jgi:hypothetical protein
MKKLLSIFIVCLLGVSCIYASDRKIYERAVKSINNYDIEIGLQKMNKIMYSDTADADLKTKAYFWVAFIELFDGNDEQALRTIKEMLDSGLGVNLDTDTMLPMELSQNKKLMQIYKNEQKKLAKSQQAREKLIKKNLKKAEKYYNKNRLVKAVNSINTVLDIDPDNRDALELKKKIEEMLSVREDVAGKIDEYYNTANELFSKEDLDKSEEIVDLILSVEPDNVQTLELKRKIGLIRKQQSEIPSNIVRYLRSAERLYEKAKYNQAKEKLKVALEMDPGNKEAIDLVNKIQIAEIQGATIKNEVENVDVVEEFNVAKIYNDALVKIKNYEMDEARLLLKRVMNSKSEFNDIKVKTYFWLSFMDMFDGNEKDARQKMSAMLKRGLGVEYDISDLPEELAQNTKLMKIYDEEHRDYLHKNSQPKVLTRALVKAKKHYYARDIDESKKLIDIVIEIDADNREALELENKIREYRRIKGKINRELVEAFYQSAQYYAESGKMMAAMYDANMALKFNPKYQKAYNLFRDAYEDIQVFIMNSSKRDQKVFQKAVNLYLCGDAKSALKIFRKLEYIHPDADRLLFEALSHSLVANNEKRAKKYFKEAVRLQRNKRYGKAKELLLQSLAIDKYYIDALMALEAINIELELNANGQ